MNSTSRKYTRIASIALISASIFLISYTIDAQPIDMYDEVMLSDEKLLLKMADLIESIGTNDDDDDDGRQNPNEQLIQSPAERCLLPIRKGVCRALIPRWSYDRGTKQCVEFKFGGCDGNGNNFGTEKQCIDACVGV